MVKQEKHVRIKDYAFNELTEFETVKIYESKTRKDYSSFLWLYHHRYYPQLSFSHQSSTSYTAQLKKRKVGEYTKFLQKVDKWFRQKVDKWFQPYKIVANCCQGKDKRVRANCQPSKDNYKSYSTCLCYQEETF